MLEDCINIFKKEYEQKGEKIITDIHVLSEGFYILVDKDGNIIKKSHVPKKNFERLDNEEFIVRDYLSKYLASNKSIEKSKLIHSNNYMSFFIKKETLEQKKFDEKVIDAYFETLSNPKVKYKKNSRSSLNLYEKVEDEIGCPNLENLNQCKVWIKENIFKLQEKLDIKLDKTYLKIFFDYPVEEYIKENKRYIIPNIYNSNKYNESLKDKIVGLPNDNMGMNGDKPYLDNKTRKVTTPYLIDIEEVLLQKKLIDYLYDLSCNGNNNVYLGWNEERPILIPLNKKSHLEDKFSGYYLRIKKGKEVEIHDFDEINGFNPKIKGFIVKQEINNKLIDMQEKLKVSYEEEITTLKDIEMLVDNVYFNKFLINNYFTEVKHIALNDSKIREQLINTRNAWFSWIYKGNKSAIKSIFSKTFMELIKNSIINGHIVKAIEQFNVREAFIVYLQGGKSMGDILKTINEELRSKINEKETASIENDKEYYFAVGQLVNYLISLNKSSKKVQSLINPFLNCRNDERLKELIVRLYKRYNFDINHNSKRVRNLLAMILSYIPKESFDENTLIAGYLYNNLVYEKNED